MILAKKYGLTLLLTITLIQTAFSQSPTSMKPILNEAKPILDLIEEEDLEIVRIEFDIINGVEITYRTLYTGWEYGIIAFGDYRMSDIDVTVYRKNDYDNWIEIAKDDDEKSSAIVTVKPERTEEYKITITPYKFNEGYSAGHYGLIIFHE